MKQKRRASKVTSQVARTKRGSRPRQEATKPRVVEAKELLRALRTRLGWTQEELAERADLLRQEINKIEVGKNQVSTVRILESLARAAGSSLEDMHAYFQERITLDDLWRRIDTRRARERLAATGADAHDPHANRTEAADIARRGGVSADAIAAVLAEPPPAGDRSTLEWIEVIRLRELQLRRAPVPAPPKRRA